MASQCWSRCNKNVLKGEVYWKSGVMTIEGQSFCNDRCFNKCQMGVQDRSKCTEKCFWGDNHNVQRKYFVG